MPPNNHKTCIPTDIPRRPETTTTRVRVHTSSRASNRKHDASFSCHDVCSFRPTRVLPQHTTYERMKMHSASDKGFSAQLRKRDYTYTCSTGQLVAIFKFHVKICTTLIRYQKERSLLPPAHNCRPARLCTYEHTHHDRSTWPHDQSRGSPSQARLHSLSYRGIPIYNF